MAWPAGFADLCAVPVLASSAFYRIRRQQVRPLHLRHPRLPFPCQLPPPGPDLTTHWPASCPFRSGSSHAVG